MLQRILYRLLTACECALAPLIRVRVTDGANDTRPLKPVQSPQAMMSLKASTAAAAAAAAAAAIASDTIRYDTIDDWHWKTDRQAASLI